MITLRLSDFIQICDRVLVMKHGSIKYDLKPKETNIVELTARIVE
jgi:ABC-type sugar transport system ATPase subunit